jgi:hypothetical protein
MAKWVVCGSDELVGTVITYVEYDGSVLAEKDGVKYRTEIYQDWGYCYCYDSSDEYARCSCTPTMSVRTEKEV